MPKFSFKLTETWSTTKTFEAVDETEAYEMANEYHNSHDIDITKADYEDGDVVLIKDET